MWRRCKSRRERWRRRGERRGRRRVGGGGEVVGCLSQNPPPVQLYLPDPLGDANDLITVSLCTARDLNGVLIASNAAIWQRDAVHLKKLLSPFPLPPPTPLSECCLNKPQGTFTASLNYISLISGYKFARLLYANLYKSLKRRPSFFFSPPTPYCTPHPFRPAVPAIMYPYLKYICASSHSTLFHLWQSVSANCPDL